MKVPSKVSWVPTLVMASPTMARVSYQLVASEVMIFEYHILGGSDSNEPSSIEAGSELAELWVVVVI